MPGAIVDWNDENLAKLESGLKAGKSASQIAKDIPGATRCSIIGKTRRLYWTALRPPKPPPDENVAQKRALSRERNHRWRENHPENGTGWKRWKNRRAMLAKEFKSVFSAQPVVSDGISLIELTNHTCRWPTDERRSDGFHGFCGQPTALDSPYCAHHLAIGTVNITRKSSDIVKILQKQGVPV